MRSNRATCGDSANRGDHASWPRFSVPEGRGHDEAHLHRGPLNALPVESAVRQEPCGEVTPFTPGRSPAHLSVFSGSRKLARSPSLIGAG